jgi:hypothetical protein
MYIIEPGNLRAESQLSSDRTLALWEWRDVQQLGNYKSELAIARSQGFNTIYLEISQVIDIYDQRQRQQQERLAKLTKAIGNYIEAARANNIDVLALAGSRSWATPGTQYILMQVLGFVISYNADAPANAAFSGLQYDVEAYNLPAFANDQETVMSDYLTAVEAVCSSWNQQASSTDDLELGFTMPFWLNGTNGYAETINWNGTYQYPAYDLMNVLNTVKRPFVAIMDYRNYADGADGAISLALPDINYAHSHTPNVRIIIGQEVSDVTPSKITFYGRPQASLGKQLKCLNAAFADYALFAGIAINDFQSYLTFIN